MEIGNDNSFDYIIFQLIQINTSINTCTWNNTDADAHQPITDYSHSCPGHTHTHCFSLCVCVLSHITHTHTERERERERNSSIPTHQIKFHYAHCSVFLMYTTVRIEDCTFSSFLTTSSIKNNLIICSIRPITTRYSISIYSYNIFSYQCSENM